MKYLEKLATGYYADSKLPYLTEEFKWDALYHHGFGFLPKTQGEALFKYVQDQTQVHQEINDHLKKLATIFQM